MWSKVNHEPRKGLVISVVVPQNGRQNRWLIHHISLSQFSPSCRHCHLVPQRHFRPSLLNVFHRAYSCSSGPLSTAPGCALTTWYSRSFSSSRGRRSQHRFVNRRMTRMMTMTKAMIAVSIGHATANDMISRLSEKNSKKNQQRSCWTTPSAGNF